MFRGYIFNLHSDLEIFVAHHLITVPLYGSYINRGKILRSI